jgi:hypothetical protein
MLALSSERWSSLRTAYGSGVEVAQWLVRLIDEPEQAAQQWEEFDHYGYLCHQETVYTATYAAVPHLVAVVSQFPESERDTIGVSILCFVGDVAGCAARDGVWTRDYKAKALHAAAIPEDLRADYLEALAQAGALIAESIKRADSEEDLTVLFGAMAGVKGHHRLWNYLGVINDERECPSCGALLPSIAEA